jgi:hypothetical protein
VTHGAGAVEHRGAVRILGARRGRDDDRDGDKEREKFFRHPGSTSSSTFANGHFRRRRNHGMEGDQLAVLTIR